ncbi:MULTISPECIES: hypothetical protein [unclassified Pseudofrankia]|uniref:hypothetical protein n=1 Tax=unclassified Pseudofrankia TaxID=2994372 RepID=UPI0008D95A59|nr:MULTISPECIES: hypothetical protein [unclassified Pseudofrankia]MDT3444357.1 hypothetical protein [Pseudofrankia sp. BMG5.37]OHV55339.1 hypothetical protein BCD48_08640 [Pseudofrankia sp. BMG5.36]
MSDGTDKRWRSGWARGCATLDELRSLLTLRDDLSDQGLPQDRRNELHKALQTWIAPAEDKLATLRTKTTVVEEFVAGLDSNSDRAAHR